MSLQLQVAAGLWHHLSMNQKGQKLFRSPGGLPSVELGNGFSTVALPHPHPGPSQQVTLMSPQHQHEKCHCPLFTDSFLPFLKTPCSQLFAKLALSPPFWIHECQREAVHYRCEGFWQLSGILSAKRNRLLTCFLLTECCY